MKFTVIFKVLPPGPFGVPEEGRTVLPGRAGTFRGDTIHTPTMTRVGYGALPEYRPDDQAISLPVNVGRASGKIRDNFIEVQVDADAYPESYAIAARAVDVFLQHLSVSQNRLFSFKPLAVQDETGRTFRVPTHITLASVTHYDLSSLRHDIEEAQGFCALNDDRLSRALSYFEHALLLFERRGEMVSFTSRHFSHIITAVFLNLWKAVTTVLGDPAVLPDGYQRRYREIGLPLDFKAKMDRLKGLRDEYDVAPWMRLA